MIIESTLFRQARKTTTTTTKTGFMTLKRETVVSVLTVDLSRKVGKGLKYHIITTMN